MRTEIDSLTSLRALLRNGGTLAGCVVQGLDLREETAALIAGPAAGAVFLGCSLSTEATEHLLATGATLFPQLADLPYRPYRPQLYTVDELMAGYVRGEPSSIEATLDRRIYRHFETFRDSSAPPLVETLAQRLHDHAVDDALADFLAASQRKVVAIMGGHSLARTEPTYLEVARLAQRLIQRDGRFLLASGGGPGAMEATHLGAWLAGATDEQLVGAVHDLAGAPRYSDDGWLESAYAVRDRFAEPAESLAVPTWFYGHEPTCLFATQVAKYFSNSLREDGLLAIARHGVVFARGSAGTIQEIFMDAAQNHYGTFVDVSPMVFFGNAYWRDDRPVFPLLEKLAAGRQYAELLAISDDVGEVVDFLVSHPPVPYRE